MVLTMYLSSRLVLPLKGTRAISTSVVNNGKRNFRKFLLHNKRGSRSFKEERKKLKGNEPTDVPVYHYGVRPTGYHDAKGNFIAVPEMIPELMVPDLTDFKLKPYVSYRVPDVVQSEFTAQDLFDAVYSRKIVEDFKNNKLDSNGNPTEPSEEEALTPEQAKERARQTGSDIFEY
ncbi:39S ribosomal protein L41, mitochondrial [Gryllus bimaculatus]|nr:39S ribosomal protein L41, mitochondrial [Gryllus bimaculatus]